MPFVIPPSETAEQRLWRTVVEICFDSAGVGFFFVTLYGIVVQEHTKYL